MLNDTRIAVRQLLKDPGFATVALLSLTLGIGANTAIFSFVSDVLLRSLPVHNPHELVLLRTIEGRQGRMSRGGENNGSIDPETGRPASTSFSLLAFERMRSERSALSEVFAFAPFSQVNILVDGEPETGASAQLVSGDYHHGLGVPALSRAHDHARRRPVLGGTGGRHFLPLLGAPLRRRRQCPGEDHPGQQGRGDHRRRDAAGLRRGDAGRRIAGRVGAARSSLALSTRPRREGTTLVLVAARHGPPRARGNAGASSRVARADLPGRRPRRMARGTACWSAERTNARCPDTRR